nr:MAG TPA_asm: hypothetical protein [Bacteriophage sp.]
MYTYYTTTTLDIYILVFKDINSDITIYSHPVHIYYITI